ncbi:MAG: hypothetical protein GY858_04300, partial [Candidatus Omnitrophica bacterium]|nr:hypothetical protein [Candidatus Omnitrophota bacterium]
MNFGNKNYKRGELYVKFCSLQVKMDMPKFVTPFSCLVVGPTKAGKSTFVRKFIENRNYVMDKQPEIILYFYLEYQPAYRELSDMGVVFIQGLPDIQQLQENKDTTKLVIFDDLMVDSKNNSNLIKLSIVGMHHWNVSCITIVQNLFYDGLRTSRINCQYVILVKNPSDKLQALT